MDKDRLLKYIEDVAVLSAEVSKHLITEDDYKARLLGLITAALDEERPVSTELVALPIDRAPNKLIV